MATTLPLSSVVAQGVGAAQAAPLAAWTSMGLNGSAATIKFVRVGGTRTLDATTFTALVSIAVMNQSSGSNDVFFAMTDVAPVATTDAIRVPPGQSIALDLYGTGTVPTVWLYGAAGAPAVQVVATFAEVA